MDEYIKKITNLSDIEQIFFLEQIQDDEKVIKVLKQIENETTKAYVICYALMNKENKIKEMGKLKDEKAKMIIIAKLQDKEIVKKYVENTTNEEVKAYILANMEEDIDTVWLSEQTEKLKSKKNQIYVTTKIDEYSNRITKKREIDNLIKELMYSSNKGKYVDMGIDPEMTVGMEIEAEGMWGELLTQYQRNIYDWNIKDDASLIDGVEINSPRLRNRKEEVEEIYQITTIMRELGLTTSQRCGGHIHIGADYLNSIEEYKELFEIYGNTEKIMYLISNRPGEVLRKEAKEYARPLSGNWKNIEKKEEPETKDEFIRVARQVQDDQKKYGINIRNIGSRNKNTIEFRIPNGTIDGDTWIENIKLFGRLMQVSKEIAQIKKKHKEKKEISPEEQRKIVSKYKIKYVNSDNEKMKNLMDLLFDEEEQKVYWERYNVNKELAEKEGTFEKFNFDKVNFNNIFIQKEHNEKEENEDMER